ncbi:MAG: glycoside hydrolase family 172 protein [Planctomycetota bacterium]
MLGIALAFTLLAGDEIAIGYPELLDQLVDLSWLTRPPLAEERCVQFSSYDRKSEQGAGNPEAWYGNDDWGQFLREESENGEKRFVMVDTDGPGCVVRIWSANPKGDLFFYVDGAKQPTLRIGFADLTSGTTAPFLAPLAGEHSRGWNCYLPLPFARHLKVTASANEFYYHVNVRKLPGSVRVPSFSAELLAAHAAEIERVRAVLAAPATLYPAPQAESRVAITASVAPGQSAELLRTAGHGSVRRLALKPASADLREALRTCRLLILFDGESAASVEAPVGDFFGTAPDWQSYAGYPLGVRADGTGYCHYPMPFTNGVAARVVNEGKVALALTGEAIIDTRAPPADALRFQARWRIQKNLATRPRGDFTIVNATGPGRYVGCSLSVRNPTRAWWGEGDEKFFVDGERFPSTFGTGTEDYFGYAWCWPVPFTHAYHNQSRCDGPGNAGYTSVNRFHIADQVPFQKSFRFDLEVWHWEDVRVDYASTDYTYVAAGAGEPTVATTAEARRAPIELGPPIKRVAGALEGEKLKVLRTTGGKTQAQDMNGFGDAWSGAEHLWWTQAQPGDRLELALPVVEAGRYRIVAQLTRARDYGIVQVSLDGKPLGAPLDLYHDGVIPTGELELGQLELAAEQHTLAIEVTGANAAAEKAYMVGLDYVRLVR